MSDISFPTQRTPTDFAIHWIYVAIRGGQINLDAPYQRKVVWDDKKQIELITCLWQNMYILPILCNKKEGLESSWVCIDGKQRLTSVRKFFDNEIYVKMNDQKVYYSELPSRKSSRNRLMTANERFAMESKKLSIVLFENLTYDTEKAIFNVIQNGVALSSAEKINAVSSPVIDVAKSLCLRFYTGPITKIIKNKRSEDILLFARIVLIAMDCAPGSLVNISTRMIPLLKSTKELDQDTIDRAIEISRRVCELHELFSGGYEAVILALILHKHPEMTDTAAANLFGTVLAKVKSSSGSQIDKRIVTAAEMI